MDILFLQAAANFDVMHLIFIFAFFLIIYFGTIRPQQKKQKEQAKFINELAKGDQVITAGGIHGKITKMDEKTVTLEVSTKTYITVSRSVINKEMTQSTNTSATK